MGGGLMQLVAYGAQDVYLTGNPQITFFKVVYRRHTNFSVESIEQTLNGSVGFGNTVTCNLSRNGDLVNGLLVEATYTADGASATTRAGFAFINECSDYGKVKKIMIDWPEEIKILIVQDYIANI